MNVFSAGRHFVFQFITYGVWGLPLQIWLMRTFSVRSEDNTDDSFSIYWHFTITKFVNYPTGYWLGTNHEFKQDILGRSTCFMQTKWTPTLLYHYTRVSLNKRQL